MVVFKQLLIFLSDKFADPLNDLFWNGWSPRSGDAPHMFSFWYGESVWWKASFHRVYCSSMIQKNECARFSVSQGRRQTLLENGTY